MWFNLKVVHHQIIFFFLLIEHDENIIIGKICILNLNIYFFCYDTFVTVRRVTQDVTIFDWLSLTKATTFALIREESSEFTWFHALCCSLYNKASGKLHIFSVLIPDPWIYVSIDIPVPILFSRFQSRFYPILPLRLLVNDLKTRELGQLLFIFKLHSKLFSIDWEFWSRIHCGNDDIFYNNVEICLHNW